MQRSPSVLGHPAAAASENPVVKTICRYGLSRAQSRFGKMRRWITGTFMFPTAKRATQQAINREGRRRPGRVRT